MREIETSKNKDIYFIFLFRYYRKIQEKQHIGISPLQ